MKLSSFDVQCSVFNVQCSPSSVPFVAPTGAGTSGCSCLHQKKLTFSHHSAPLRLCVENSPLPVIRGYPHLTAANRAKKVFSRVPLSPISRLSRLSNFPASYKPKPYLSDRDTSPRSIKLPKTLSNFINPKKRNPLFPASTSRPLRPSREIARDARDPSHGTAQNTKNINVYGPWDDGTGPEGGRGVVAPKD